MRKRRTQNPPNIAAVILTRSFDPSESIALFLRCKNPAGTFQGIVPPERTLAFRYMGWLAQENASGANIYGVANPLRSGSRKRTKESIAAVPHLYLDLDADGEASLASLLAWDIVSSPNAIVSTWRGKYQVLWRVDGFTFEQQESTLKLLAITFGGDPTCTDCYRVLRPPGFLNCKYDPAYRVTVEYPGDSTSNPGGFRVDITKANPMLSSRAIPLRKHPDKRTNSERDWAWVLRQLTQEKDVAKLTRCLACRRSDKRRPGYYTPRTVDVASARLWLIQGLPMDDTVTMLEVRRHSRFRRTLSRSCAGDCSHDAEVDCPQMVQRRSA